MYLYIYGEKEGGDDYQSLSLSKEKCVWITF